jgi:hypothetical protein
VSTIRFAVLLGLIVVGAYAHRVWAQSADEAAIKKSSRSGMITGIVMTRKGWPP